MIQNIIFDMGQVLKRYDPDLCIAPYISDKEDAWLIRNVCFTSGEWVELDRGTISYREAISRWKSRLPERLHGKVDEIIANWHRYMTDIPETGEIVRALWEKGYAIYLLSNVSVRFEEIRSFFPALAMMKGIVISSEEKLLKPDPKIYRILLDRYNLSPDECVFIDDAPANVSGAEAVGIHGIRFDMDAGKLIADLAGLGVTI